MTLRRRPSTGTWPEAPPAWDAGDTVRDELPPAPRFPKTWLAWWRARGVATQATAPGAYAWAVTVAPVGWSKGASVLAGVAAASGIVALAAGPLLEKRSPQGARLAMGWGVVASAVLTWIIAPETAVSRFDAARGIAGTFGWGLFAFAVASPPRVATPSTATATRGQRRQPARMLDRALLLGAFVCTVALEIPGWRLESRDRALFVRLVALAGGLGFITTAGAVAVGLHPRRGEQGNSRPRRLGLGTAAWVAAACALLGAGAAYAVLVR